MERHVLIAQARARQLSVVGGAMPGCRLIIGARLVVAAQRLGGAPLPITRAGQRGRTDASLAHLGEVSERGCRVVEKTQCDPAGRELGLPAVALPVGSCGIANDPI